MLTLRLSHVSQVKRPALTFLAATLMSAQSFAATVTTTIDPFTTGQLVFTNNGSISNTQAGTSIGGYRTLVLNSLDPSAVPTFLGVDDTTQQLILDSPPGVTPTFEVIWGGVDGTNGLGGVAFGDGNPLDLLTSVLTFSLAATDQPNNFTWSFIDTATNTATYTGSFPAHSATDPSLPYSISLNSFANATNINWNAIDFIVFAGGGATSVDMTLDAPIQVSATSVPEPGTWALLVTGLAATTFVLRRQARRGR